MKEKKKDSLEGFTPLAYALRSDRSPITQSLKGPPPLGTVTVAIKIKQKLLTASFSVQEIICLV